ncbi:MAG: hypothetical protein QW228_05750 [Candidatus Aenigmatarchaeota archaeon]
MNGTDLSQFINLGVAGIAVMVIWLIVQRFLQFVEEQEKNFKNTIDNHLKEFSQSNQRLAEAIKELLDWLKYHNGKK